MTARGLLYTTAGMLRAPWRLLFFVGTFLVASIVASGIASPIVSGIYRAAGVQGQTVASVVQTIAVLAATWAALRWLDRRPWSEVGLDAASAAPSQFGRGFVIGSVAVGIPILLLIALGWLDREPTGTDAWGQAMVRVTMLLLPAALFEELLMRGYIMTAIRDAAGWAWATVLTSVAFGLLHYANPGAGVQSTLLVTLAGFFLAAVRIATGSLYAAWMAHFAWNWVMSALFHVPVSGLAFDAPSYRYVDSGPDWATGGPWGPEGGVPAGLAMITATGLLLQRRWRRAEGDR